MTQPPKFPFYALIFIALLFSNHKIQAQAVPDVDHSYKPLQLKLNEDGSKYLRIIMWHQLWAESNNLSDESQKTDANISIRRSRFLAYSQISPRFLVLTHWGLNSLNASNLSKLGNDSDSPQLFLHDTWAEYKVIDQLHIGAGLIYWNGLTRRREGCWGAGSWCGRSDPCENSDHRGPPALFSSI